MKELQTIAKENSLPSWEIPVDVVLEPHPFTVENGLLTSTLKKSRPRFEQKYQALLEDVYAKLSDSNMHRFGENYCVSYRGLQWNLWTSY